MNPHTRQSLSNGLQIEVFNETNRYFGDYHRVCLRIVTTFDLDSPAAADLADTAFWGRYRATCGNLLQVTQRLVRMGVPGAAVEPTVSALLADYFKAAEDYMSRPSYPRLLAAGEMAKLNKSGPYY